MRRDLTHQWIILVWQLTSIEAQCLVPLTTVDSSSYFLGVFKFNFLPHFKQLARKTNPRSPPFNQHVAITLFFLVQPKVPYGNTC